jgi:tetraacyldisaccharide 4'-kinase
MRLRIYLERCWYGERAPLWLQPLAGVYALVVRLRRLAYARGWFASRRAAIPVTVIGNLTVGGTGKTPLVMWLAMALREAGQRPGIALRGYGVRVRGVRLVRAADDPAIVGDEAVLIARRTTLPVAVGADRAACADLLARAGCTLVLADDGLQHLALRRDLAIVVIDGARGFGNGALLPAGPLREPATGLAAADVVVVRGEDSRGCGGAGALRMELTPEPLRNLLTGEEQSLEALRGAMVHAVAGIGHPGGFFALLRRAGLRVIEHPFADHHRFRATELQFGRGECIVMTEKDAVKCAAFAGGNMWYLPVSAQLSEPDAAQLRRAVLATIPGGGGASA